MKGIQFLLCLIALHTVVGYGEFIGTSSWITLQDKTYAVRHILQCENWGGDLAACVANSMSQTDPDNEYWCCVYASGNKRLPNYEKFQKWFLVKTPKGKYSCSWKDPLEIRCG